MSKFLKSAYQSMRAYVPGEQPKVTNLIKLNTNESPYPPSPRAVEAVGRASVERLRLYSDIMTVDLAEAISERYGVNPDQVIAGNGSDEILAFIFLAYGDQGVQFPDISYGFYPVWASLFGLTAYPTPLREDFTIDPGDYLTDRRLVVVANPNAPTGIALSLEQIRMILDANPDQVVAIDEAYVDFGAQSAVSLIGEYENLLVVQTFSKSRSLAGGRLGFALGSRALIEDLSKMKFSFNPYNVNSLTQLAGAAAMRDEAYFEECRQKIMADRAYTAAELRRLGFRVLDSSANFLFARPPGISGASFLVALRKENILVRRFQLPRIEDYLRITVGTREQMRRLIEVTETILKENKA